ncbi:antibiotic biosynthesis monooxygenase [Kribbella sp. NPDC051770]|uniref:putative quinol monooxygenase n=1 Tax=Kribbella sp. NPDC051770 TaxID=3155413 RepID=UPI003432B391
MKSDYGFQATMTAKPGMGNELIDVLLSALEPGKPASSEYCVVYLVSRSASDADVVHVTEGWTTEEDHHRVFAGAPAQAIVARVQELLGASTGTDYTPINGKAAF